MAVAVRHPPVGARPGTLTPDLTLVLDIAIDEGLQRAQARSDAAGEWHHGLTENISRSGVLFRARQPIEPTTNVELTMTVTDTQNGMMRVYHNPLNTRLREVLAPVMEPRGIGLVNASPLHMGILTPAGPPPWHPAPAAVKEAGRTAVLWCEERGIDLPRTALRIAMDHPSIASTLVGVRTSGQVEDALAALTPDPHPEHTAGLLALLAPVADREWPSGLPENSEPTPA